MPNEDSTQLYTTLHRLGRQMHRFSHRAEGGQGSYREQSRLLRIISRNDGVIQRDIAEEMDASPSSMTEMLVKMEQLGYIIRKQDEKDQCVMHIYLTNKGKVAVEESVNAAKRLTTAFKEIKQMLEMTSKLYDNLGSFASDDQAHRDHHERHACDEEIKQMIAITSELCDNLISFASDDHAHGDHHGHHARDEENRTHHEHHHGFDEERGCQHDHGNHHHSE